MNLVENAHIHLDKIHTITSRSYTQSHLDLIHIHQTFIQETNNGQMDSQERKISTRQKIQEHSNT